jgi:PTS system nitrogen regulatory IIA component
MPYLNLKQVAEHLGVSEKTIYRLISKGEIPVVKVGKQWRFNRLELENWLKKEKPEAIHGKYIDGPLTDAESKLLIYNFLRNDGMYFEIPGISREEVLENAINSVNLEPHIDRNDLLANILEREKLCSTGGGHGIAIPHPNYPHNFSFNNSSVFLCFLKNKVDFDAIDHLPVDKLFLVLARNVKEHLYILKVLNRLFHEENFFQFLSVTQKQWEILENIKQAEESLSLKELS